MNEFVEKAKKGDGSAFYSLVEGKLNTLYKIAFSFFRDRETAQDAVQDTIFTAFKSIGGLKDPSKFNSWLTSILINRCRDIYRHQRKYSFEEYIDENANSLVHIKDEYSAIDASIDISSALRLLGQKYRDVIILKYMGDCTISEIAVILKIPEGTVKSRLSYGLGKLKEMLEVKDYGMQRSIK